MDSAVLSDRSPATLQELIARLPREGGHPAVLAFAPGRVFEWSYAQLAERVRGVARGLADAGLQAGERVVLHAPPSAQWIALSLGILEAGGVVVPLDVQLGAATLQHILDDCRPRFLLADAAHLRAELRREGLLTLDSGPVSSWLEGEPGGERRSRPVTSADPAALFYTSGTTGPPKGVPLTHANLAFQLTVLLQAGVVGRGDRVLLPLPLHHVYPFVMGIFGPLVFGIPIILPQGLTGPQIVRALREGEATVIIGVPRLYSALLEGMRQQVAARGRLAATLYDGALHFSILLRRRFNLRIGRWLFRPLHRRFGPQLRMVASGGAALPPEVGWRLEGLGWKVAVGYGLTETSPLLTLDPPGRARIGTVGRVVPGVELRIARAAAPAPAHRPQSGEIEARGPGVFDGYYHLPEKTAEAFTPDGWFRTGDRGYVDADGYLHITGRVSTLIVAPGGENIQPEALEEAYAAHEFIREIGILQRDGRLCGLVVPALPALGRAQLAVEEGVRQALGEQARTLPSYQRVSEYAITREPLPRTRLGKIRRHLLPTLYEQVKLGAAGAGREAPPELSENDRLLLEDPAVAAVWNWLRERYSERRITPDTSPQLDLGLDSLDWVNITLEIGRRAGVELGDEAIDRIGTVRDLLQEVAQSAAAGSRYRAPLEEPEAALDDAQRRWLAPHGAWSRAVGNALHALNRRLMRSLFRVTAVGAPPPEEAQVVFAPNHTSYLDPFALGAVLGQRRLQRIYWGGWTGAAFRNRMLRFGSRLVNVVPVDPERGPVASLTLAAAVLKRGDSLVWFPEGERSRDGELLPFKSGLGLVLSHHPVAVVPVAIRGAHEALPRGARRPRLRRPITIVFGTPLRPQELAAQGRGESDAERITDAVRGHVARLLEASPANAGAAP